MGARLGAALREGAFVMMLWLLEFIGLKGMGKGALLLVKWAVRLVVLVVLLVVLWFGGHALFDLLVMNSEARTVFWGFMGALAAGIFAWRRRRRPAAEAEPGERTIDGKVVPEKLAVAALGVPAQSPDGEYVLRGLPDYGKALLKLDSAEFVYLPPPPEKEPELPLPVLLPKQPTINRSGGWAIAAGVVTLFVIAGVVIYQTSSGGRQTYANVRNKETQPVAALRESAAAPSPGPAAPQAAQAPAPAVDAGKGTPKSDFDQFFNKNFGDGAAATAANPRHAANGDSGRLSWTRRDNGPEPIKAFEDAEYYCRNLELAGLSGWRLPTYDELQTLINSGKFAQNIKLSNNVEILWSSTLAPDGVHHKSRAIGEIPAGIDDHEFTHVICVTTEPTHGP
jgi:hypothetical protein